MRMTKASLDPAQLAGIERGMFCQLFLSPSFFQSKESNPEPDVSCFRSDLARSKKMKPSFLVPIEIKETILHVMNGRRFEILNPRAYLPKKTEPDESPLAGAQSSLDSKSEVGESTINLNHRELIFFESLDSNSFLDGHGTESGQLLFQNPPPLKRLSKSPPAISITGQDLIAQKRKMYNWPKEHRESYKTCPQRRPRVI